MDASTAAIIAGAVGAAVGAIIEQLGGWANDHLRLRRAKLQTKISEEEAKRGAVHEPTQQQQH